MNEDYEMLWDTFLLLHQLSLVVFVFEFVHSFFCLWVFVMDFLGSMHSLSWICASLTSLFHMKFLVLKNLHLSWAFYFAALGCKRCTFPWFQCSSPLMPHHSQCKCQSFSKISPFCNKRGKSWYWRRTTFLYWWLEPSPSMSSSRAWKGNGPKLQLNPSR